MIAEIRRIKELWGDNAFFELADDNSFANRHWAREFLTGIQDLDLRWFTETDISIADDDELLRLLAKSGCRQILIGLESVYPISLDGIDRANWKLKRLATTPTRSRRSSRHGVTVNGCFIVGNDGDDQGVFEALRDFIEKSELLEAQVTILTPFPGTALLRRLQSGRTPALRSHLGQMHAVRFGVPAEADDPRRARRRPHLADDADLQQGAVHAAQAPLREHHEGAGAALVSGRERESLELFQ